jgi:hypothetical protein
MRHLLVVLALVSALGVAAPAYADPNIDVSFLDALKKAGITFDDEHGAVTAGKSVCKLMNQGQPEVEVVHKVVEQNPRIGATRAAQFTAIATSAYCPQYLQPAGDDGGSPPPAP